MKKILSILFFCFFAASSYAQSNLFPTLDSLQNYIYRYVRNSTVESFTNLRLQNSLIGLSQLIDSLAGNGAIDSIWLTGGSPDTLKYRLAGVTITVGTITGGGGSSYTFTNGLTESAGTVRLGGTLTQNTTIAGGGFSLDINNLSSGTITAASATEQAQLALATNNPSFNYTGLTSGRFHNLSADSDGWGISATRTGASTFFNIGPDSLAFRPHLGQIFIDTIASVGVVDTTNNKVLVYNTGTKRMQRMSWPASGGGVAYTLINGGNNIGTGSEVFKDTSSNKLNFRKLNAGTGISVTQNTNDITIAATNVDSSAARVRTGTYAQRVAITSPSNGDVFTQTDRLSGLYLYKEGSWRFQGDPLSYWFYNQMSRKTVSPITPADGYNAPLTLTGAAAGDFNTLQVAYSDSWLTALLKSTDVTITIPTYDSIEVDSVLLWVETEFVVDTVSNGTNDYGVTWGFDNSTGTYTSGDRIVFRYNHAAAGGDWETRTVAAGSGVWTTKDTGIPFVAGSRMKLAMEINGYNRSIIFYINDVIAATHTSPDNVPFPNATTLATGISPCMFNFDRLAGTTQREFKINYIFGYYIKKNF